MKSLLVFLVLSGGCALAEMDPGDSCASCHNGRKAPAFGAAGTVYAGRVAGKHDGIPDVAIDITDSSGRSVSLASNAAGNFFTREALTPPLQVTLTRAGGAKVSSVAPSGDCNSCHKGGSTLGRLFTP